MKLASYLAAGVTPPETIADFYQQAADEAENSRWARQTRHRATDIVARLRGVHKP